MTLRPFFNQFGCCCWFFSYKPFPHLMYHMLNRHVMFALLLSIIGIMFRSIPFRNTLRLILTPEVNSRCVFFHTCFVCFFFCFFFVFRHFFLLTLHFCYLLSVNAMKCCCCCCCLALVVAIWLLLSFRICTVFMW